jgi:single-strand DNA-binding protein
MLKASVIGNLGNDPELRYSPSGAPSLRLNDASNFRARTPEGEWEDRTEWVRVIVFGQRAESLAQYLKKGMRVFVDGRLEARPWTDRENRVRAGLEIVASDIEFVSTRHADDEGQEDGGGAMVRGTLPSAAGPGSTPPVQPAPQSRPAPEPEPDGGELEDLPF